MCLLKYFFIRTGTTAYNVTNTSKKITKQISTDNSFTCYNAIIFGVDLDYETVGDSGSMLMVTASGTDVRIED